MKNEGTKKSTLKRIPRNSFSKLIGIHYGFAKLAARSYVQHSSELRVHTARKNPTKKDILNLYSRLHNDIAPRYKWLTCFKYCAYRSVIRANEIRVIRAHGDKKSKRNSRFETQ